MSQATSDILGSRILSVRGQRVILDADLSRLYSVSTSAFNQAIRRNGGRFPPDFAFRLTPREFAALKAQIADIPPDKTDSSQFVTSPSERHRGAIYRPWAFTEHGAVMAANVLRSPSAIQMSVHVVRAFILQREALATNTTIANRFLEIEKTLLKHDSALRALWQKLQPLLMPPTEIPRKELGFHTLLKKP